MSKDTTTIYPEMDIEITEKAIIVKALVRKQHEDGQWYITLHWKEVWLSDRDDREKELAFAIKSFTREAYVDRTLGKVDTDLRFGLERELAYTKDEDQRTEEERIRSLIP